MDSTCDTVQVYSGGRWRCSSSLLGLPPHIRPKLDALSCCPGMSTPSTWASLAATVEPPMAGVVSTFQWDISNPETICIAVELAMGERYGLEMIRNGLTVSGQVEMHPSLSKQALWESSCFCWTHIVHNGVGIILPLVSRIDLLVG